MFPASVAKLYTHCHLTSSQCNDKVSAPLVKGANGQNEDTIAVYNMTVHIGGHMVNHPFQVIQGLHEDAIMGIDFINMHKMIHNPRRR